MKLLIIFSWMITKAIMETEKETQNLDNCKKNFVAITLQEISQSDDQRLYFKNS